MRPRASSPRRFALHREIDMAPFGKKFGLTAMAAATTLMLGVMALPDTASAQYGQGMRGQRAAGAQRSFAGPRAVAGQRSFGGQRSFAGQRAYGGARYGYRGGRGWNRGGLALGAIAAGAMTQPAPAPVYEDACHIERQRYWNGYRWRIRDVEVCP